MNQRDHIVSFINHWHQRSELPRQCLLDWLDLPRGRFRQWELRQGNENAHNGHINKAHWLLSEERQAIIDYARQGNLSPHISPE